MKHLARVLDPPRSDWPEVAPGRWHQRWSSALMDAAQQQQLAAALEALALVRSLDDLALLLIHDAGNITNPEGQP